MEEKDFEPAGLIPRSIVRTVERFRQQLRPETVALAIQEFRISRYQVRVSVRYFFILLFLPVSLNWGAKTLIITPLVQYFWNTYSTELFLNTYQAERAFQEMRDFESQLLFEMLLSNGAQDQCSQIEQIFDPNYKIANSALSKPTLEKTLTNSLSATEYSRPLVLRHKNNGSAGLLLREEQVTEASFTVFGSSTPPSAEEIRQSTPTTNSLLLSKQRASEAKPQLKKSSQNLSKAKPVVVDLQEANAAHHKQDPNGVNSKCFAQLFQEKTVLLAEIYNQQSIAAVSNMFGDLVMIISTVLLIRWNAPQFTILKSFLIESFYSFNDAIKSFYIILVTDFLVGFHSPRGWEITMEMLLRHLGLPEDEEFILLFVGTFPVFLDTAFKYWIFRYLNKISPSTVATYHNMIE